MRTMLLERFAVLGAVVLVCALTAVSSAAGPDGLYTQVRVEFSSAAEMEQFMMIREFDVMSAKPGRGVTVVSDPDEVERFRALGYNVTVEIEDMESFYASRVRGENFGDFHTFSETIEFLDDFHAAHPLITTEKFSVGTTYEGRTMWAMKISDNPEIDELEPEILIDGLHHAREVICPEVIMHFMSWLGDNYGTDEEATFLVNEREIWVIPIVNPDGFVYNEAQNPNGGGMWRQNRQPVGGGCFGTDNNRNYDWEWGTSGVSHNPCDDETYCGPNAFSEIENLAMKAFAESREFVVNLSFHSVVGATLIPWAYDSGVHTPDDALLREIGTAMGEYNGYEVGQCGEILWYSCSGSAGDWLYGAMGVPSFCVEMGGSGFWPQESELPGLRVAGLWPQRYLARIGGTYLDVVDSYLNDGVMGNGEPDPGETVDLQVTRRDGRSPGDGAEPGSVGNGEQRDGHALVRRPVRAARRRQLVARLDRGEGECDQRVGPVYVHRRPGDPRRARARRHGHGPGGRPHGREGPLVDGRDADGALRGRHGGRHGQLDRERRVLGPHAHEIALADALVRRQPVGQLLVLHEHLDRAGGSARSEQRLGGGARVLAPRPH